MFTSLADRAGSASVVNGGFPIMKQAKNPLNYFNESDLSRIIEMAWEDRTPFEAIESCFGLSESSVIQLMRRELKSSSFRSWRERVHHRKTKHLALRNPAISRGYCPAQYKR